MRVRTTWNPELVKQAAMNRQADPYTMNQTRTNPPTSKYETGSPSTWAEDPHPSGGTWEAEYSNGQVKREEIGLPEFRKDTFNHPEKTAAEQQQAEQELAKKAMLAEKVARRMLPKTASESLVEDQAFAMMQLPNEDLVSTYARLAAEEEQQDSGKPWEDKKAQEEQEQQEKQAQQQEQQDKQAQQQQEQDKQAGQMPPQFRENAEKKEQEAKDKKDDDKDGQKEASVTLTASALTAAIAEGVKLALAAQAAAAPVAAAPAPAATVACGQPMAAPVMGDDAMLDQMLADGPMVESDIIIDAPEMGVGDLTGLGPDDDVLLSLFASDEQQQSQQEKQAQDQQGQEQQQKQASRAMGTRPAAGVSRVGGSSKVASQGDNGSNLERLWQSAPDVSAAFGMGRLPTTPAPASPPGPHPSGMPRSYQQGNTLLFNPR